MNGREMPDALGDLSARADELASRREPFVRATVVRAQRPTSAHAGDVALIVASGDIFGFVGGNCVEASVRRYALQTLSTREPLLLRVVPGEPSLGSEEGAIQVSNPCLSGGAIEIFLEPKVPAPRMVIVGTTPIAEAVGAMGTLLGFAVSASSSSPSSSFSSFADVAAVIVASHGSGEEPALEAALRAGVPYVALVASQVRGAAVLASLDVDEEQRARVHSPAGLLLGGHTPAEVALSIVAELVQERAAAGSVASADSAGSEVSAGSGRPDASDRFAGSAGSEASAGSGASDGSASTGAPGLSAPISVAFGRPSSAAVPLAIDPVCGMSVVAIPASLHVDGDAGTTYFCSEGCRRAFLADPERYAVAS
jgi:xanthine dehydrogenase accessory factor